VPRRIQLSRPATEGVEAARGAALHYVTDAVPGIRRIPSRGSFRYVGPDSERVRDRQALGRIRSIAIPPAWKDVWICPLANGHLQATGRDARGRKQYGYNPRWRQVRDENKYEHGIEFGRVLPRV